MVKIRGPLHSVSASGSVAGNLTFSQRKSGQQARWQKKQKDYVNPARANVRSLYSNAVSAWNSLTKEAKNVWKQASQGKQMTGYNFFVQDYITNSGFIIVNKNENNKEYFENPASNLYGKTYFLVMQYQARNNGGVPQSTGDGLPWTSISQLDAIQKSKDAGYHLITNWEWMAIARDIEQVPENWTGGAVGSGVIKKGNAGNVTGSYNGADPETGILNDLAKLKLSNGEEIYHFSGNVWEWVNAEISLANLPSQATWTTYNTANASPSTYYNAYLPKSEIAPLGSYTDSYAGGAIYYGTNTNNPRAFLRGGGWGNSSNAGVFAVDLLYAPESTYTSFGFRCAR